MVLCYPVTGITPGIGGLGEFQCVGKRVARRAAFGNGGLVEDAKSQFWQGHGGLSDGSLGKECLFLSLALG